MDDKLKSEFLQDERVFVAPVGIFNVPNLTMHEQMTYFVLRSYYSEKGKVDVPSYELIAKKGRMTSKQAIKAVEGLMQKGLINK